MSNTASKTDPDCPRIIITAGEPAGIGPDLIAAIGQHEFDAELIVVADPVVLTDRAGRLGLALDLAEFNPATTRHKHRPGRLPLIPIKTAITVIPGKLEVANARYVLESIRTATMACLKQEFNAMVTAPVNKAIINASGSCFSGHTEFIADLCGDVFPVMMLMNQHLRIALVTTHLPLSEVPQAIEQDRLLKVITIVHDALQSRMGIVQPRISVCGLNPHAGETGYLGNEEQQVILPVLEKLRSEGFNLHGPVPADTAFTRTSLRDIDAVITMYHDQGLPVLKAQGFGETINITLGLPILRTSVDHGTALDLAATGNADPGSLLAAINCAIELSSGM